MGNRNTLENPYDLIDEIANEEEKQYFELDDILVYIATALIKYRVQHGLTQEDIARKLGCSVDIVEQIEECEYDVPLELFLRILSLLKLKLVIVEN